MSTEEFLEAACVGDLDQINRFLIDGIDVNVQHPMNKWSALHWASKRNHASVVEVLLNFGADTALKTTKGEVPLDLASNPKTIALLGGNPNKLPKGDSSQAFVPSYLSNPPFPYLKKDHPMNGSNDYDSELNGHHSEPKMSNNMVNKHQSIVPNSTDIYSNHQSHNSVTNPPGLQPAKQPIEEELVLKVRIAYMSEPDFIEIELPKSELTFHKLVSVMCQELVVKPQLVKKIRKLPDTILRKDKDVQRLTEFQELELILTTKSVMLKGNGDKGHCPTQLPLDVVY